MLHAAYVIGDNGFSKVEGVLATAIDRPNVLVKVFDVDSRVDVRTSWQLREATSTE